MCESGIENETISCPFGQKIVVVHSFYGRADEETYVCLFTHQLFISSGVITACSLCPVLQSQHQFSPAF